MFRITNDPSTWSLIQYSAKIRRMVRVCVCVFHCIGRLSYTVNYTHAPRAECAAITPTTSMSTDTIELFM